MAASLAPGFILIIIAKAGKGDRPSRRHPACLEVIAQVLQDDCLVPLFVTPGEFDQGLQKVEKESVLTQSTGVQVVVHLGDITRLPEVHQTVDLVDERSGTPFSIIPHRFPLPLMPRT